MSIQVGIGAIVALFCFYIYNKVKQAGEQIDMAEKTDIYGYEDFQS